MIIKKAFSCLQLAAKQYKIIKSHNGKQKYRTRTKTGKIMKRINLISRTEICLYLLLATSLFSCTMQPIDNYGGAIIHKKDAPPVGERFILQINTKDGSALKTVYVSEYDYKRYEVGDTIKVYR